MNRLTLLRYERGLTQQEVSAGSGVPLPTIKRLETGDTVRPSAPTAKALADFYEISVADLLGIEKQAA